MTNKKVIGLGGVARAGKDTFAGILAVKLQQAGKSVRRVALAEPLKYQVDDFLVKHLGITAFITSDRAKDSNSSYALFGTEMHREN